MDVNNSTINDGVGDPTETILEIIKSTSQMIIFYECCWSAGTPLVKQILNKDITDLFEKEKFQCGVLKGQKLYPGLDWEKCDKLALRIKVNRVVDRVKTLRKNNKSKLNVFLQSTFCFQKNRSDKITFQYLQEEERNRVKDIERNAVKVDSENKTLKRQIKQSNLDLENLEIQIDHYERKSDVLLKLLNIAGEKCKTTKSIQKENRSWGKKFESISNQLDESLEQLDEMKVKFATLGPKNVRRKINRRDEKISKLEDEVVENKNEIDEQAMEIDNLRFMSQENVQNIENLTKDKRRLLVKVCRLAKKCDRSVSEQIQDEHLEEIQNLKTEIRAKQDRISELENLSMILADDKIESFYDGKHLTRLPSAGVKSRLLIEAKRVAQKQIVEEMLSYEYDLPDKIDPNTYIGSKGNCLHQDATSKFHKHYQSFQLTTHDNKTLSVGLNEVGSGDAASIMSSLS
ncbi:unnamed protein product [Mytilus coruscus]|uniref:Uncharacterized protein n=1 Tax=Mytilus coruscus TaxID=42192 RepID=A0A6J8B0M6_MYTCO|nr:unnamed protein product [Mytilus coruscus]